VKDIVKVGWDLGRFVLKTMMNIVILSESMNNSKKK